MIAATYEFDFKNFLVVAVVVVFAMVLAYRLLNRDDRIKRTRFGFFVERNRYEDEEEDVHHLDPFTTASEARPAPLPPPTPPPPLPPRPDDDDETQTWPQREESP